MPRRTPGRSRKVKGELVRSFRRFAPVALSIAALLGINFASTAARAATPVPHSIQQVYTPGSATTASAPVDGYAGDLLSLQGTDVGMTALEPTIGVTSDGTAFFAAATIVADSSQAWGGATTHTLRSSDHGLTWQDVQFHVPQTPVGIIPANADPFVWVDRATDRVFNIDLYAACSWLNYSDDGGDSWMPSPEACGVPVDDHQTIASGIPVSGYTTTNYPRILYYCVNQLVQTGCGRSLDGGLTWLPTGSAPLDAISNAGACSGLTGHLETDAAGRLFLPSETCGKPMIAISEDAGDTWKRIRVSDLPPPVPGGSASDNSVAVDSAGNLYYTFLSKTTEGLELPYVAVSTDHGDTWGAPLMVAPPGVKNTNFPVIEAGDAGRIAVSFPGTLKSTESARTATWNQYVAVSTNALDAQPVFVSATGNDPANPIHRGTCLGRCGGLWDFLDVQIDATTGEVWATSSDDCIGICDTGTLQSAHAGEGIAIKQIGGPTLRA
jgi:hypothetical protein